MALGEDFNAQVCSNHAINPGLHLQPATEDRDAARRVEVRRQLEEFVKDKAGSLKMLARLRSQGKLLLMQVHGESRHKGNCSGHL
jgi:hypothetical protein